jgi:hypothetical protein
VPTLQQLQSAFNDYQAAYFGSLSKETLRDSTRVILTALHKQLEPYLELVAQGDTAILATTGSVEYFCELERSYVIGLDRQGESSAFFACG